jgi:hypothetical protein
MIHAGILDGLGAIIRARGLNETAIAELRRRWPGVSFTLCAEDDVPARLAAHASGDGYAVYLVSGAEHCVAFTEHVEAATGLVLAAIDQDD